MNNNFGYFTNGGSEYVVTEPNTKLPFVNYYWNDTFISGCSQHLAGIGCFTARPMQYMHPVCRALLIRDENRHFYLRDTESGVIWSPGWYPALTKLDSFACRHGLGYSILNSSLNGIESEYRIFVPSTDPVEVWTVTLKNTDSRTRTIQSFALADWYLRGYEEYCDPCSALISRYCDEKNIIMCFNETPERTHAFFNGFLSSDLKPTGFDSSKRQFMGYGQMDRPQAIVDGKCRNSLGACEELAGVLEHTLTLEPNESVTFHILMGAADSMETAADITDRLFAPGQVEAEFEAVTAKIRSDYSKMQFETPEPKLNYLFNHWIKRSVQLHTEVGTDTGKGLRDVLQAAWAVSSYDYAGARSKIVECLQHQYAAGNTLRGWNPVDDHHYSDGPVWIAPAIDSYLKETRDFDFLNEVVPYFDEGEATVLEHMLQSLRHASHDLGQHGLVRIHYGDWNDSLNMMGNAGIGESVWTTIGIVFALNCAIQISEHVLKDAALTAELDGYRKQLSDAVNTAGWDGNWYLQGYNDLSEKVGTHTETEGRVFLNPQSWSILAGIVPEERKASVLSAIDDLLECDYGSMVLTPAYKTFNPNIGRISGFIPGMWENASPYCHGTSFKIVADTYLKRGNIAYRSMMKILPDSELNPSAHSGVPPYMVTNMYYGPENPRKGEILYSWITGTADWLFKAMGSHFMGVMANYDGLVIDPCVPSHWDRFSIRRSYLSSVYEISFENPNGKESGVTSIEVDGQLLSGNLVPAFDDGKVHQVKVVM